MQRRSGARPPARPGRRPGRLLGAALLLLLALLPCAVLAAVRDAPKEPKEHKEPKQSKHGGGGQQHRIRAPSNVTWTPITQGEGARVDMWTMSASGCPCPWNTSQADCACCVKEGGCHCGEAAPQRCAQCGLEKYCANMCNATIDSVTVLQRSGRSYGMIKSSSMDTAGICAFTLLPDAKQRVELQLYRLVGVGRYHNNSCHGGSLQLTDGSRERAARGVSLCGANERFTTPVVMFADRGPATLTLRVSEPSERSQFLAYYSFTPANASGVGFLPKGGKRRENTECDWLYQDFTCTGGCVLASPGYPGLYPGGLSCGYLVTASSVRAKVTLELLAVNLPLAHCATDNIIIYHGSGPSGLRVHTICDMSKTVLELPGPNIYIQFNAGPSKPPYNYNGFLARLDFGKEENVRGEWRESRPDKKERDKEAKQGRGESRGESRGETRAAKTSTPATTATPAPTALMDGASRGCAVSFRGSDLRSGVLDSRHHSGCYNLSVEFHGRPSDIVKLSIFNYKLKAPSCASHFDIFLGPDLATPDKRLCSPMTKHAHDPSGRFQSQQTMMSRGSHMALHLVRTASLRADQEFVDGAFLFHDKSTQGHPEPDSLCSARFLGPNVTAAVAAAAKAAAEGKVPGTTPAADQAEQWGAGGDADAAGALQALALPVPAAGGPGWAGSITSPGNQHLFWNVQGQLKCTQTFEPQPGQSVTLSLAALGLKTDPGCWTYCDGLGCRCFSDPTPLSTVDHVRIMDPAGYDLSCLCGDPQKIPMPLSIRSWGPLSLEYNVAHFTWAMKGFSMQADYSFQQDGACGRQQILLHSGTIESWRVRSDERRNHFVHMDCKWVLLSNIERELRITVTTPQSQPCGTWNITIHRYNEDEDVSRPIFTFCPRDSRKTFDLPWKLNSVIVRLWALSPNVPEFSVSWHSQVAQAIMHKAVGVTSVAAGPAGAAVGAAARLLPAGPWAPLFALLAWAWASAWASR